MKKLFTVLLLLCLHTAIYGQVELILGYNLGRYTYMEAPPHNYSSQFNNGWAVQMDGAGQIVYFKSTPDQYKITNKMNYDRWNTGLKLGFRLPINDKSSTSIYFLGATNRSSGDRINLTTNQQESFAVKSKFGGIYVDFTYQLHERIGLSAIAGFERYKLCYSYESDTISRKMSPMGWNLNFLSGEMKPKSKEMNASVGLGLTFVLLKMEKLKLEYVTSYRWVFNDLSEVYRGSYYDAYLFNLNSWNNNIQLVYQL